MAALAAVQLTAYLEAGGARTPPECIRGCRTRSLSADAKNAARESGVLQRAEQMDGHPDKKSAQANEINDPAITISNGKRRRCFGLDTASGGFTIFDSASAAALENIVLTASPMAQYV
jgi:hypothetical protein